MSLTSETMTPADIAAVTGNNNNGMWGDGAWWIIVLLLFGWGRNGNGWGGNGNGGGVSDGYVLASDFANIERKIDGVNNGLCDGFYAQNTNMLNGFAGVQNTLTQGFAGLNTGIVQQGYENRLGQNMIQQQIADCCCTTQQNIKEGITQGVMNTSAIQSQINQCCCDNQKDIMQIRFDMATQNCGTLQAIDKLGDRIENRLTQMEVARLNEKLDAERTANAVLQGRIDRAQLRTDIVNDVRPCPAPAYITCNPWAYQGNSCNTCGTCGC